jgi:uncharacterized protein YdaU (DUF1376 family)
MVHGELMSRHWMPFYVGDYLQDTRLLTLEQHGAYLLLIMHYWTQGGLPPDEKSIRRILGLNSESERHVWRSIRLAIAPFFQHPGWRHKRIDAELKKQEETSIKRKMAGQKGGRSNRGNGNLQRFSGKQLLSKGTANHNHNRDSYLELSQSAVDRPQAATSEASKRPHELGRAEFDQFLQQRAKG